MTNLLVGALDATKVEIDKLTVALWEYQGKKTFASGENDPAWTRDDIETVVTRVNRGALLLDKDDPGWVEKILPAKLDMSSSSFCVIGQTYGTYEEYVGVPFGMGQGRPWNDTTPQAIEHGFLTEQQSENESIPYELLDRVWVAMLTERHDRQEPVVLKLPPYESANESRLLLAESGLSDLDTSYKLRIPAEA